MMVHTALGRQRQEEPDREGGKQGVRDEGRRKKGPMEETFPIRIGIYESYAVLFCEWLMLPEQVLMAGLLLDCALTQLSSGSFIEQVSGVFRAPFHELPFEMSCTIPN